MSAGFRPLRDGAFLPLEEMLVRGALRLLDRKTLARRDRDPDQGLRRAFGRTPDFIDGHQHVHLFPQVRDALLDVVKETAPRRLGAAMRPRAVPLRRRCADRKALLLDVLSAQVPQRAPRRSASRTNPAFAGTYDFAAATTPDFARAVSAVSRRAAGRRRGDVPSRLCRCRAASGSIR